MIDMEFIPYRNALIEGTAQDLDVMLKISASPQANMDSGGAAQRAPLNIAVVIDRSGSMAGQPLAESIRCAEMIVDRLTPLDRLSIIGYDDAVTTYLPSMHVHNRQHIKNTLREITPGGMTALYDGWHAGAEQVAHHLKPTDVSRVLLLSDGCANVGLTDPEQIASHCREFAATGISTSTYGLGRNFNEQLMAAMAHGGQGQAHYGQTADDLMDPFQEEFDLLDALCARKLRLHLSPEPGVTCEVINDYQRSPDMKFILPDLAHQGYVWALIRAKIDENVAGPSGRARKILTAHLSYSDMEGGSQQAEPCVLHLTPMPSDAYEAITVDPTVRDRSIELQVARLQSQAAQYARIHDWDRVSAIVDELQEIGSDNAWVKASLQVLSGYQRSRDAQAFAKEAYYKAHRMNTRIAHASESSESWSLEEESSKARFLRKKMEQGKRQGGGA
jgi:Ca-activated chloride channel homolog